jgi:hypothetical protein
MQQSPSAGLLTTWQSGHSQKNTQRSSGIVSSVERWQAGQVIVTARTAMAPVST